MRACPTRKPLRSITEVNPPAASPMTIAATKNVVANDAPNSPTNKTYSPGLVNGDGTMKATTGAHGTADANAPRTTAVVPHRRPR
jgi:hypothetical protein